MSFPVITVDGPSGAGKGTLCFMLANTLGYRLLDSGALYRIVGLQADAAGLLDNTVLSAEDEDAIVSLTEGLNIQFLPNTADNVDILVNGTNVADEIRNEKVGGYASKVAALPKVRAALFDLQKNMASESGLIADGRDMGTVIFPDADAKIFLTASANARAQRRVNQLQQASVDADYATILANIQERDERDENRQVAPSKPAADALVIDSSDMDVDIVFSKIKEFCQQKGICFADNNQ